MPNGVIEFGGVALSGIIVTAPPALVKPSRKYTKFDIPNRNGSIIVTQDAFNNYDQPYEIATVENAAPEQIGAVFSTLFSGGGYKRLQDDFDATHFRLAAFNGPADVENILNLYGTATLIFDCRPERFLISGETPVTVTNEQVLSNTTAYNAKPLIYVEGTTGGTITIGGKTLTVSSMVDYLYLDCEAQDCYRQPSENRNSLVSGDYPSLAPGNNTIAFTGFTKVVITPRYFEI